MKMASFTSVISLKTKFTFVCTGFLIGLISINSCDAQSVVGKWKEVSGKNYFNEKVAKENGEKFIPAAPQMGGQVLDIKADHSFTSSELMNWIPSQMELKGTWALSGDQLNTTLNASQPDPKTNPTKEAMINNYKLSWIGNNMILSLTLKPNPVMERMEKTYVRM